jgi:hypothetical protein
LPIAGAELEAPSPIAKMIWWVGLFK